MPYISKIKIGSTTYEIKDAAARQGGLVFHLATNAANTPAGVQWDDQGTIITGTLPAWNSTEEQAQTGIYLVKAMNTQGQDIYDEYVAVSTGDPATSANTSWERLGNTEIDFSDIAAHLQANVSKTTDKVLGEATTFTNAASAVSYANDGTSETFVKSYPGAKSKLATTTVKGVGEDITFNAVASATDETATNTVFGTDTSASAVTTKQTTVSNARFDDPTTASKATAGTAVTVAKAAAAATNVSYVGNSETNQVFTGASVTNEILEFDTAAVQQGSVTGTNGTESITPYTFADVTVPVVTQTSTVTIKEVDTNTSVAVPVVTSNTEVTTTKVTTASKTAATSAANATTVATGSLDANGTGDEVMTGLGTPTTDTAFKTLPSATAAAQAITVGTNDKVDAVTNVTVEIANKTNAGE